ncbi:hypothetical protein BH23VER1_BH23VER1_24040 [soil metagenome]
MNNQFPNRRTSPHGPRSSLARRATLAVSLTPLVPTLAFATPEAIHSLATGLPNTTATEVVALAESHVGTPLAAPFEDAWWHLVFYRWCQLDRPAAGTFAQEHPRYLRPLLLATFAQDEAQASAFAGSLGEEAANLFAMITNNATNPGAASLSPDEFASAVDGALGEHSSKNDRLNALNGILRPLTKADPAGTLTQIESLPVTPDERYALMVTFMRTLSQCPPEAVFQLYDRLPGGAARADLGTKKAHEWARTDPGAAMAWAESLPPGHERDAAMTAAAAGRMDENPLALFDFLDAHDWRVDFKNDVQGTATRAESGGGGSGHSYNTASMVNAMPQALRGLVSDGRPHDALARLAQVPDTDRRRRLLDTTLEAWIKNDSTAATEWMLAVPDELRIGSQKIADGLDRMAIDGNSARVTEMLGTITDTGVLGSVARDFAKLVAERDRSAIGSILTPLMKTTSAETRGALQSPIADGLAEADPSLGAEFLLTVAPDATADSSDWSLLISRWADIDPGEATQFFAAHPDVIRLPEFENLASQWARTSPEAASSWIGGMPAGAQKDSAIGALVGRLTQDGANARDLETALLWADEIADPVRSEVATRDILEKWREIDPASAPQPAR